MALDDTHMAAPAGYVLTQRIASSHKTEVWKGYRELDGQRVIVKLPCLQRDSSADETSTNLDNLEVEYNLLRKAAGPGIIPCLGFAHHSALIFKDHGGRSLSHFLRCSNSPRPFSIPDFLKYAIQLSHALGRIHSKGILHMDVKPSNIIFYPHEARVVLADFSLSRMARVENVSSLQEELKSGFHGSVPYISPEQTGRISAPIDFRSDLYSLGATFFEMLTSEPPFGTCATREPLQIIHSHIAVPAPCVRSVDPEIPEPIARVIARLLSKLPSQRYPSAYSLYHDLLRMEQQLKSTGSIDPAFRLGDFDVSQSLSISSYLYGREKELKFLEETVLRQRSLRYPEKPSFVVIKGCKGVGKTALVRHLTERIQPHSTEEHRLILVDGKYSRNDTAPYSGLAEAIRKLINFGEESVPSVDFQAFRAQLRSIDFYMLQRAFPELGDIIGSQGAPSKCTEVQESNDSLFAGLLVQLLSSFPRSSSFVIVLDGFQWASTASLELLRRVLCQSSLHNLTVIATYENQDSSSEPFKAFFDSLKSETNYEKLQLNALNEVEVRSLLENTLCKREKGGGQGATEEELSKLTSVMMRKTLGNALYLREFLHSSYQDEVVWFDFDSGMWRWDLAKLQERHHGAVIEILAHRINKIPQFQQQILQTASCIGMEFDVPTLASLLYPEGGHIEELIVELEALQTLAILDKVQSEKREPIYKFVHERVRYDAYWSMPEASRASTHLCLAQKLLLMFLPQDAIEALSLDVGKNVEVILNWRTDDLIDPARKELLLRIVSHLNKAHKKIVEDARQTGKQDLLRLSLNLNVQTGRAVKKSRDYASAATYFQSAISTLEAMDDHLPSNLCHWDYPLLHDFVFKLFIDSAEAEYLSLQFPRAKELLQIVKSHAKSFQERIQVLLLENQLCFHLGEMSQVLEPCLKLLEDEYGVSLHQWYTSPTELSRQKNAQYSAALREQVFGVVQMIKDKGLEIENLADWPTFSDLSADEDEWKFEALSDVMFDTYCAAFRLLNPFILGAGVIYFVRQLLEKGFIPSAVTHFGMLAYFVTEVLEEYTLGCRFHDLFQKMLKNQALPPKKLARAGFISIVTGNWRADDIMQVVRFSRRCFQAVFPLGDFSICVWHYIIGTTLGFVAGIRLDKLVSYYHVQGDVLHRLKHSDLALGDSVVRCAQELLGTPVPATTVALDLQYLFMWLPALRILLYTTCFVKSYLLGQYQDEILQHIDSAEDCLLPTPEKLSIGICIQQYALFSTLALIRALVNALRNGEDKYNTDQQRKMWDIIDRNTRQMKVWAELSPQSYSHWYLLIKAEITGLLRIIYVRHMQHVMAVPHRITQKFGRIGTTGVLKTFSEVINAAQQVRAIHVAAMANESAALFLDAVGLRECASFETHIRQAFSAYNQWRAFAKTQLIARQFPIVRHPCAPVKPVIEDAPSVGASMTTSEAYNSILDVFTVMKATQALSTSMCVDRLIEAFIQFIAENTGASKVCLILNRPGRAGDNAADLYVKAILEEPSSGKTVKIFDRSDPSADLLLHAQLIPLTIVEHQRKMRTPLILADATSHWRFSRDPYVQKFELLSVLCFPILHKNLLFGILYLDNPLIEGAFTTDRIQVLELLGTQLAISIVNTRLYEDLQRHSAAVEKKNEELRQLNQFKDNFLANTTHELRTPLNAIIGMAEHLLEEGKNQDGSALSAETRKNLSVIAQCGRRLLIQVNDVLDLSSLRHAKLRLHKVPLRLKPLVDDVLSKLSYTIKKKRVRLINQVEADGPLPLVLADENRLSQIMINLVQNGIKFTPEGSVTVSASFNPEDQTVLVRVSDTGIGIPEEFLPRAFAPFEQADASSTREHGGAGLGLAISKQLVELHGGTLRVVPHAPHPGTTLEFTLQAIPDSPPPDPREHTPEQKEEGDKEVSENEDVAETVSRVVESVDTDEPGSDSIVPQSPATPQTLQSVCKTRKVLVVDDNRINVKILCFQMKSSEYETLTAQDGMEALKILETTPVDVLLVDVMMPKMDGYQLCREIRKKYDASVLPVIFLTAKNRISDLVQGFEAGGNDFITKPFSKKELFARMNLHVTVAQHVKRKAGQTVQPQPL